MRVFIICVLIVLSGSVFGGNGHFFQYNKAEVDIELSSLDALEDYVKSNNGITLKEMKAMQHPLVENTDSKDTPTLNSPSGGDLTFWQGYLIGVAGCLVLVGIVSLIDSFSAI